MTTDALANTYAAILDDPAADTPRLAHADALDEAAQDHPTDADALWAHAALIRLQIECSLRACRKCKEFLSAAGFDAKLSEVRKERRNCHCGAPDAFRDAKWLSVRPVRWFHAGMYPPPLREVAIESPRYAPGGWFQVTRLREYVARGLPVSESGFRRVELTRGFVDGVSMRTADFYAHAADLFSRFPLTRVTLHDARPVTTVNPNGTTSFGFFPDYHFPHHPVTSPLAPHEGELPAALWAHWHAERGRWDYERSDRRDISPPVTRGVAEFLLTRAAFTFGREQARLRRLDSAEYVPEIARTGKTS